jgi:hypothetical protein
VSCRNVASFFPPSWWFHASTINAGIGAGSGRKIKSDGSVAAQKHELQDLWIVQVFGRRQ